MDNLIVYLLKVSAGTVILYLFYLVFFSMDSFHRRNRIALLSVLLLPLVMPLLRVFNFSAGTAIVPSSGTIYNIISSENQISAAVSDKISSVNVNSILDWIYLSVAAVFLIRTMISVSGTLKIIRKGMVCRRTFPRIVISESGHPAFSFFPYAVIPRKVFESDDYQDILEHELVHIRQGHTFDLLLCELVIALQWFNPFVWLIRKSMILNHEYLADNSSVKSVINKKTYQYRLLNIPADIRTIPLAHSFTSSIKKRLVMINKKPTRNIAAVKAVLSLPVVAILLILFSFKPGTPSSDGDIQKPVLSEASAKDFYRFIFENIRYPEEARNSCDTGHIYVVVKIRKGGIVEDTRAISDPGDIKVPMMDEVVVTGYKPSSAKSGNAGSNPSDDHPVLKAECLRIAGQIGSLDIPELKEKDMEFALAFKFILK
jgi:beta-lactamase regulating signal transducer with metallopeptidase domain